MFSQFQPRKQVLIGLLLAIGLIACNSLQLESSQVAQETLAPSPSESAEVSAIPISDATGTPSPITLLPSATALPSATIAVSPSPIATLSETEKVNYISNLIAESSKCEKPCWWGIQPGITTWQSLSGLLIPIGWRGGIASDTERRGVYYFVITDQYSVPYISLRLRKQDEIVQSLAIHSEMIFNNLADYPLLQTVFQQYSLDQILIRYGKPTQVLIGLQSARPEPNGSFGYELWLFYDELGLAFYYYGTATQGQTIQFCPTADNIQVLDLYLQSPTSPSQVRSIIDLDFNGMLSNGYLQPLEESTALDLDLFYTKFSVPNNHECIKSPANIWP